MKENYFDIVSVPPEPLCAQNNHKAVKKNVQLF